MKIKNKLIDLIINIHYSYWIYAALFAICGIAAQKIADTKMPLGFIFVIYFVVGIVATILLDSLSQKKFKAEENKKAGKKLFIKVFVLLLISYFVCLLSFFPGVGMNDGLNILYGGMTQSGEFPVFYCGYITALAKIGRHFGSFQISIALYSIIQIVFCSLISAGILYWIYSKKVPRGIKIFSACYFALMPIICMYSISMLKDTVFSLLLVVFSILIYEFMRDEIQDKKRFLILSFVTIFGILTLRNNGKYVVALCLLIALITKKTKLGRKTVLTQIGIMLITLAVISGMMHHFHSKQLFQEVVGIPIQQVAATVKYEGKMTKDQKQFIGKVMPIQDIKKKYNPYTADPIKWDAEGKFNQFYLENHKKQFIRVWAGMLPHNLGIYSTAYLKATYHFWAPTAQFNVQAFYSIETYANNGWLPAFAKHYHIHDQSLMIQPLQKILRGYYHLGYFLDEGTCFWIIIMFLMVTKRKDKNVIYFYLPTIALWLTIMVSTPISGSLRYVLIYVYLLPEMLALLCGQNDNDIKKKRKDVMNGSSSSSHSVLQ